MKNKYTRKDLIKDLYSKELNHIKSLDRFADFYNELGKMEEQQKIKYLKWRMDWIEPQGKILELGSQMGHNLIHYARLGFECLGVEISQSFIDMARYRIKKQPRWVRKRIRMVKSFIESFKTKEKFETILLTEVLEHVINPLTILKKASKLLAKNGKIFITSPNTNTGNNSHVRGVSLSYLIKLLEKTDLKITHQEKIKGITAVILKKNVNRDNKNKK